MHDPLRAQARWCLLYNFSFHKYLLDFFTEFRECFYLYAQSGQIHTMNELAVIMRSLGMNPTKTELTSYMKEKNGKLAFADFLDVMHTHSTKENLPKELLEAFRCGDPQRKGMIPARDLRRILVKWGEKLSSKEGKIYTQILILRCDVQGTALELSTRS